MRFDGSTVTFDRADVSGVYVLFGEEGECLYVGETEDVFERLRHHKGKPYASVKFTPIAKKADRLRLEQNLTTAFSPILLGTSGPRFDPSRQTIGHTKFQSHCAAASMKQYKIAEKLDTTAATVSRWLSGKATPSDEMKRRIETLTGGAIAPGDWVTMHREDAA